MANFHSSTTPTARKSHICSLCSQEIPVREKYKRWTGKWCGDFYRQYFHLTCCDLIQEYVGLTFGEEEWSSDCIHDWLYDECCRSCSKADDCEQNVFRCDKVLNQIFKGGNKCDS